MFGNKQYPSQLRYPTPESIPVERGCRTFSIPNDATWFALLMGALMPLLEAKNFVQNEGGITAEAAAEEWLSILWDAWMVEGACDTLDRPYWDDADADDAGDSETDGFPWYENASDWLVGAFLASAGLGEAAFEFVTIARRFRLYFRQRDYGAIVNVFLDDVLQASVDTYSATEGQTFVDIFTVDAVGGFSAFDVSPYTLRIEHSGTANPEAVERDDAFWIEVIRKRLWEAELGPVNQRYNADCDCIQETFDDGATWVDRPLLDPRSAPQYRFPALDAADPRCQAAANIVAFVEHLVTQALALIVAGEAVAALTTLFALLFLPLGIWAVLIEMMAALAAAMFAAGAVALLGAFGPTEYDDLLCVLFCAIGDDGQVSDEQLARIYDEIAEFPNPLTITVLGLIFSLMGPVGLSNQGTIGTATPDCDDCTECLWCREYDLAVEDGGFTLVPGGGGAWTPGTGWTATYNAGIGYRLCQIQLDLSAYTIDAITVDGYLVAGGGAGNSLRLNYPFGTTQVSTSVNGNHTLIYDNTDGVGRVLFLNGVASTDSSNGGETNWYKLILQGHGDPPPGGIDCYA